MLPPAFRKPAAKTFSAGAILYRRLHPDIASPGMAQAKLRKCPECRKATILPRERLCADCRKKRRRETMARAMQLQRRKNGSHV
jgi:hypothetical protein